MRPLALVALLLCSPLCGQTRRPLLVISIDGLDHRYLRDADALGMQLPTLRRLAREGEWADGVIGVHPTVTWPSHTTLITGRMPHEHGILANRRPAAEGGDYYWSADLIKGKTLWHAARQAGLKSAAITWPVTVNAAIDYNLPEAFSRRNGGAMDLDTIEEKATPGLIEEIARAYPSFATEWMDDRARMLATVFLLAHKRPDLILLHLVDHDAAAHERGPFSREAKAILEYTDELIGRILQAARGYVVALVSDHGFERTDRVVHLTAALKGYQVVISPTLLLARDEAAAKKIRELANQPGTGIGRQIPKDELRRFAPQLADAAAAFEPAPHCLFGTATDSAAGRPRERGNHGFWPTRKDYRATFLLWGPGIHARRREEIAMVEIAPRLAAILGIKLP